MLSGVEKKAEDISHTKLALFPPFSIGRRQAPPHLHLDQLQVQS
jgi:hypothetical protein